MKILVVYYSRTNTTKKVAGEIASKLNCDLEEIIDIENRKGIISFLQAAKNSVQKKITKIEQIESNMSNYDSVIIGTPIWSWSMSIAVRTFLKQHGKEIKSFSLFCTQGKSGGEKTFREIEKILNKRAIATLELRTREVAENKHHEKINNFILNIKK